MLTLNSYAIIRRCLVEEEHRPEMGPIRALLCHSNILSKRAFEVYKYNIPNLSISSFAL